MKKILYIVVLCLLAAVPCLGQQTQHGIKLTWTQSTTPGVVFNTVYSATKTGGPYTVAFTSSSPITSYLASLTATNQGTQACFVVTATVILESLFSTETCSTFPVPTASPTALQSTQQ